MHHQPAILMNQFLPVATLELEMQIAQMELEGRIVTAVRQKAEHQVVPESFTLGRHEIGFLRSFKLYRSQETGQFKVEIRGVGIFDLGELVTEPQRRQERKERAIALAAAPIVATIGRRRFPFHSVGELLEWAAAVVGREVAPYNEVEYVETQLARCSRVVLRGSYGIVYVEAQPYQGYRAVYTLNRPHQGCMLVNFCYPSYQALLDAHPLPTGQAASLIRQAREFHICQLWAAPEHILTSTGEVLEVKKEHVKHIVELDFLVDVL